MGRAQFALIHSPPIVAWLRWLLVGLMPQTKLWPSDMTRFRQLFAWLIAAWALRLWLALAVIGGFEVGRVILTIAIEMLRT